MRPVVIDVATGAMEPLGSKTWVDVGRPVWLPDGSGVLFPARERSEGAFQFWIARYPGGEAARITNDARGFGDVSVSVTADGSTIATVPWDIVSNLFSTTPDASAPLEQWTSGVRIDGASGMAPPADGRVVFASADGIDVGIWSVDAPGARPRRLTRDYAESPFDTRRRPVRRLPGDPRRAFPHLADGAGRQRRARALARRGRCRAAGVAGRQVDLLRGRRDTPALMRMSADGGDAVRVSERGRVVDRHLG